MKITILSTLLWIIFTIKCELIIAQDQKDVTLATDSGEIHGTLLFPNVSGTTPVALIIAGSGPTDRNGNNPMMTNNSLKMLAEELLDNNIATLRYDKRGIAGSMQAGLNERELTFSHYIDDARAWIDYLAELPKFDRVFIIGHSEGSLIGMVAARHEAVDGFISLAGVGRPADEILKEQLKNQSPMAYQLSVPIIDSLAAGHLVSNVPQGLNSLFRPSVQPYIITWFQFDPQKEIGQLAKPILILQGDTDIQVGLVDADLLHKAAPQSQLKIIPGMNHILKNAPQDRQLNLQTYNQGDLPLHEQVGEAVSRFILK